MPSLTAAPLPLAGLARIHRCRHGDERGAFARLFCVDELAEAGWHWPLAQVNHSITHGRGTVRGLHFQHAPHAEAKLVSCVAGEVWDVAVDVRAGSPTFLHWHAERLSAENGTALLLPPGFAHGFQVLSESAELVYCHSAAYAPASEAGLHVADPRLAIAWPRPPQCLSDRDAAFVAVTASFQGVVL